MLRNRVRCRSAAAGGTAPPCSPAELARSVEGALLLAEPAVPEAPAAPQKGRGTACGVFDGDWPGLVARIDNRWHGKMLAQTALRAFSGSELQLILPSASRHLADKGYQDKLRAAWKQCWVPMLMKLTVGDTSPQRRLHCSSRRVKNGRPRPKRLSAVMIFCKECSLSSLMGASLMALIRPL